MVMIKMGMELASKYKGVLLYAVFGVMTTMVNIVVYFLCVKILGMGMMGGNVLAWVAAVIFAYVTNRRWVFGSDVHSLKGVLGEMAAFFGCRLATGILDMAVMYVGSETMELDDMAVKCFANVLVILTNYVASKLIIFKRRD